jgi:hypothetical protein
MNRIDKAIEDVMLTLDRVTIYSNDCIGKDWPLDVWRGQLADARALAHELDHEAIIEGRKCE